MREKGIKRKRTKSDYIIIAVMILSIILIILGIYFLFFSEEAQDTQEGYERQNEEENIANDYILHLLEMAEQEELSSGESYGNSSGVGNNNGQNDDVDKTEETEATISMDDIIDIVEDDPNYYERDGVTYTPDYAQGYLAFVLDVPTAGIKRGVYGGTWEEIAYDLDIWMVTLARPDYELGETHLCIYGHNHTSQDLSFNNLHTVQIGDEFYIYCEAGYYRYEVTDFFGEWRSTVTKNYVDNFNIGADKCYIITCGRNEYRYKDVVVEGTLAEHLTLQEYAQKLAEEQELDNALNQKK